MDRTERFYLIDQLLQKRRATSMNLLISELEVSRSTVKRDLRYMRDRLYAPIVWDSRLEGYRYEHPEAGLARFSLPGLWFNSSELHALLTMEHLLDHIQPGFLGSRLEALRNRVRKLLEQGDHSVEEMVRRIRICHGTSPMVDSAIFQKVANAVLARQQIFASHLHRHSDEVIERYISPQRLIYYNENWYLDGWCHLRNDLRTFRLHNLSRVDVTDEQCIDMDDALLDSELTVGFGIFVGKEIQKAELRFSSFVSRWVVNEQWHSNQHAEKDETGRLVLTVPYSDDPELIMRILRYGPDVEVLKPPELREKVAARLLEASVVYVD